VRVTGPRKLSSEFLSVGGLIMVAVMIVAGYAITSIVSRDAVRGTAVSSALFLQAIMGEHVAPLVGQGRFSGDAVDELNALFATESFRQRFPYLEIWSPDATVIYSNSPSLIGQQFPAPAGLRRALTGEVAAEYTDLTAGEHTIRGFERSFLEIYVPLRASDGSVVAVAEIHEAAEPLEAQLRRLTTITWAIVAGSTLLIGVSLFGVVRRGGRKIEEQERDLRDRVDEAERRAAENRELRDRVRKASVRVSELNEGFLKRIGADLHDGPTQLLSLSVLQASALRERHDRDTTDDGFATLLQTLDEATQDIRGISRGLLVAETADETLLSVLERARHAHEIRTGVKVDASFEGLAVVLPPVITSCAYRFVQEGLTNAHRHSGGGSQAVSGRLVDGELTLVVENEIAHAGSPRAVRPEHGLGLVGLTSRAETIGGRVTFERPGGSHARLEMTINIHDDIFSVASNGYFDH
jgi:signal transduction histidine kinase